MLDKTHQQILDILKVFEESDFNDMALEFEGIKIKVSKSGTGDGLHVERSDEAETALPAPAVPSALSATAHAAAPSPDAGASIDEEGLVVVQAPMLGNMYRAPGPGEKPFVDLDDEVGPEDTVCLIECMKLFNTINAGASGTIVRFLVENGSMVEFGQPILLIRPK